MVRAPLTFDASLGRGGRFVISNADMVVREEWARLSTADSALSGTQIVAATMLPHASAFPNRSAIVDLNKKDAVRPTEIPPKAGASAWAGTAVSSNDGPKKKRD